MGHIDHLAGAQRTSRMKLPFGKRFLCRWRGHFMREVSRGAAGGARFTLTLPVEA
jgi:hypothetical protein